MLAKCFMKKVYREDTTNTTGLRGNSGLYEFWEGHTVRGCTLLSSGGGCIYMDSDNYVVRASYYCRSRAFMHLCTEAVAWGLWIYMGL